MTKYLVLSPDRYARFGHQTSSISTGLLLAYMTESKVIWPRYMYSCDKWNKYIDFSRSKFVATEVCDANLMVNFIETPISDKLGNRKWDLNSSRELSRLVAHITALDDKTITFLPFDQTPGILHRLYNKKKVREDIQRVFQSCNTSTGSLYPYVAIHVRRGDVTEHAHPSWFVNNEFYIYLLEVLDIALPSSFGIHICTQGNTDWLADVQKTIKSNGRKFTISNASNDFINDSELEDFIKMREATILFTACSGFSHWAAVTGNHKLVIDVARDYCSPLAWVTTLNPESSINTILEDIKSLA